VLQKFDRSLPELRIRQSAMLDRNVLNDGELCVLFAPHTANVWIRQYSADR